MTGNVDRVCRIQNRLSGKEIVGCFAQGGYLFVVLAAGNGNAKIECFLAADLSDCLRDRLGIATMVDQTMLDDLRWHQRGFVRGGSNECLAGLELKRRQGGGGDAST